MYYPDAYWYVKSLMDARLEGTLRRMEMDRLVREAGIERQGRYLRHFRRLKLALVERLRRYGLPRFLSSKADMSKVSAADLLPDRDSACCSNPIASTGEGLVTLGQLSLRNSR